MSPGVDMVMAGVGWAPTFVTGVPGSVPVVEPWVITGEVVLDGIKDSIVFVPYQRVDD
jgi:hypothetical protein